MFAIAEWFVERLAASAQDVCFLLFIWTKRSSILVYDGHISLDDDGALRIAAYFGRAGLTGIRHDCFLQSIAIGYWVQLKRITEAIDQA